MSRERYLAETTELIKAMMAALPGDKPNEVCRHNNVYRWHRTSGGCVCHPSARPTITQ